MIVEGRRGMNAGSGLALIGIIKEFDLLVFG